jgi:hypothetical protein
VEDSLTNKKFMALIRQNLMLCGLFARSHPSKPKLSLNLSQLGSIREFISIPTPIFKMVKESPQNGNYMALKPHIRLFLAEGCCPEMRLLHQLLIQHLIW